MSNATDATEAPLPVEFDPPADVDDTAAKILAVVYGVTSTLEATREALAAGDAPAGLDQDHVDALEAAFRTGERIREHPRYWHFLDAGPSALPDELADEIDETLAPVASAYGVDLEHVGDDVDLADHFTGDVARRCS